MKKNSNSVIRGKIITACFWWAIFLDLALGIKAFVFFYSNYPKLIHVGQKVNQTGIDALIQIERDTVLRIAPSISIILVLNSFFIFLLLRELKLNADKQKTVRAGDNL
jgi:hypothetical protein